MDVDIRGYYDRKKIVVNLACQHGTNLLVSSFIQYERRGLREGIVHLARCVFHFIREHENLVYYPSNNLFINIFTSWMTPERNYVHSNPHFIISI